MFLTCQRRRRTASVDAPRAAGVVETRSQTLFANAYIAHVLPMSQIRFVLQFYDPSRRTYVQCERRRAVLDPQLAAVLDAVAKRTAASPRVPPTSKCFSVIF